MSVALVALVTCSWPRDVWGYRPFDGTDADVAAPEEVEIEVGPAGYQRRRAAQSWIAPALVLNYGVAPGFEAVLEGRQQWAVQGPRQGELNDVALSLKSLLRRGSLQASRGVSVALESGLLLPGSERRLGVHVASIFSWQWPALTLHFNLGNDLLTSFDYTMTGGVIVEGPVPWPVRPVGELLVARSIDGHTLARGWNRSALLGAIAPWRDGWVFDLGLRHGFADGAEGDELRLGFTWSFGGAGP